VLIEPVKAGGVKALDAGALSRARKLEAMVSCRSSSHHVSSLAGTVASPSYVDG
jgi:predicted dinucleotide-binding enzyme